MHTQYLKIIEYNYRLISIIKYSSAYAIFFFNIVILQEFLSLNIENNYSIYRYDYNTVNIPLFDTERKL